MTLDGNTLDDCSLIFSWLSARPWVPRVWPGPLPGPLWIRLSRERRVRWKDGSGRGAAPFSVAGGLRGSGKRGPRPGDVGGSRWVFLRVRHHGPLRLAPSLRVSVARVGQDDVFPVGVSDRQVLLGCVARPCAVGLYKGSFWVRLVLPGLPWSMAECAAVGVTSIGRPSGGRR